jgi:predicted dehydrogenase/nucleoside-diphosphate-sugar epimerase
MAQHHARAIGRTGISEVVGVADPSETARAEMLKIAPSAKGFATLSELLGSVKPDVVHIVTPPPTHEALARQALAGGCHIYVEKPFVEDTAAAAEILRMAQDRGLYVCPGHQLLYEPPARLATQYLPALGQIVHIESYFSFRPIRRTPDGQAAQPADIQLMGVIPHPIYVLLQFLEATGPGTTELKSLEVGRGGTIHALVQRGDVTGALVVTLQGRPIESYLKLVGSNGSLYADFVRSTVQRNIGPGTSGIDKLVSPYRQARQLLTGTTVSLGKRFLKKQASYPGLVELFTAFYQSIQNQSPPPFTHAAILETVRIWVQIQQALQALDARVAAETNEKAAGQVVAVTGGAGFLGKETVRALLREGHSVRVLGRSIPASWDRESGVEYVVADLSKPLSGNTFKAVNTVIHCAAETAGGWEQHQRNSIDATQHVMEAAASAGVRQFIHVSSSAVLASPGRGMIDHETPLEPDSKGLGPYVWGKLESERLAVKLGDELGLPTKVVRPAALVEYSQFDPPGRLGKRLGNFFVAVGSPGHHMGVVEVGFCARTLTWMVTHFGSAPSPLNLLSPTLPTKRDLIRQLKKANPDLTVVWLPGVVLHPLSWFATLAQKTLRPGKRAINVAKVFAPQRYSTSQISQLEREMARSGGQNPGN